MSALRFDREFEAPPGVVQQVAPSIRRLIAPNSGPLTFTGTCTYIVGQGEVAVIDPGPDDPAHIDAIMQAVGGECITHILVSHRHKDHSPGASRLAARCGALIYSHNDPSGYPARMVAGSAGKYSADAGASVAPASEPAAPVPQTGDAVDRKFIPDVALTDGARVAGGDWTLTSLFTPGHLYDHMCYALEQEGALFTGDHVMAWSTSIVAPPDGNMGDYMASLERLRQRDDRVYWPGHGGPVRDPATYVPALISHRRQREQAIIARLRAGDRRVEEMISHIYPDLDSWLVPAACLSVLAHLEELVAVGRARVNGHIALDAEFYLD